ncbi:DUF5320 domain-containing protein [bacterium]|nr:DUF5320 domain-containing protein [bacterium]MBU1853674.1 DUF5320 domain-containing protein [Candidatus Omnitrophota bacterium]
MPGGDGTGPGGMGPMTGRAAGYCAGYSVPGYMNPIAGRGRFGYGLGLGGGRGFGRGRGLGRGFGWRGAAYGAPYVAPNYPAAYGGGYPYAQEITPQQETDMLKEQSKAIGEELEAINKRISELESAAKEKK